MIHLFIILMVIGFFVLIGALILFFLTLLLVSIFGGASAALIIKDKIIKRLLFMGFSIMFLAASTFLLPFVSKYIELPVTYYPAIYTLILILTGILAIAGIRAANSIANKIGRIVAIVLYSILCVFTIPIIIFIGVFMIVNNVN